jgi:hypothetical protein
MLVLHHPQLDRRGYFVTEPVVAPAFPLMAVHVEVKVWRGGTDYCLPDAGLLRKMYPVAIGICMTMSSMTLLAPRFHVEFIG